MPEIENLETIIFMNQYQSLVTSKNAQKPKAPYLSRPKDCPQSPVNYQVLNLVTTQTPSQDQPILSSLV